MESQIKILKPKKLIGMHMKMSLSANKTAELWQKFMPKRSEVTNRATSEYISMQVYSKDQKNLFAPTTLFEKWAAVEVLSLEKIPDDMDSYSLTGGKYAVFIHEGPASEFLKTMQYIFGSWLPESEYTLDNREHFEMMPENYSPVAPDAREEVWIPIK